MARTRKLEVILAGDAKGAVQAFDTVESKSGGLAGKMASVAKVAATAFAAVGTAAVAGGALAVNAAMGVETGLREVNTLFGLSGKEAEASFKQMQSGVADLSAEVGVAQEVLVGGLYQAISAGIPKENAFTFMEVAAKAAIAGVTDTETAVDGLTTIINAFGLEASEAQAVADSMFTAVKGGKTNFQELSDAMFNVAPAAAALGVDFKEVNAAIATLTASGTPTSVATTQLRAAMTGLTRPSAEVSSIFKELGFESAQVAIESKGLGFAMDAVRDAADGDVGALQKLLGSTEAVSAVNVLAGTSAEKFAQEIEAQGSAAGATQAAYEEMEKSVSRKFERVRVMIGNALIEIGNKLLPAVTAVAEGAVALFERWSPVVKEFVQGALASLSAWWTNNGPAIIGLATALGVGIKAAFDVIVDAVGFVIRNWDKFKVALIAGVALLLPHFVALGVAATVTAAKNVAAWATMTAAGISAMVAHSGHVVAMVAKWAFLGIQALAHAAKVAAAWLIAMGPIGLVIAAVAGLVALVIIHWDTIKRVTLDLWNKVKEFTGAAWDWIKNIFNASLAVVQAVWNKVWGGVKDFFGGIWDTIKNAASAGIAALISLVTGIPGRILSALGNLGSLLFQAGKNIIQGLIDGIKAMIGAVGRAIGGVVSKIRNFLPFSPAKEGPLSGRGAPNLAGEAIASMLGSGIRSGIPDVARAAASMANAASLGSSSGIHGRPTLTGRQVMPRGGEAKSIAREVARTLGSPRQYTLQVTGSPVTVDEGRMVELLRRMELLGA